MHRLRQPEQMDAPDLSPSAHLHALHGLARINQASASVRRTLAPILAFARARNLARLHLLDVACGGGEVPIGVAAAARRHGLTITLSLLDQSPLALAAAARRAAAAAIPIHAQPASALARDLPSADVVTCSLFLHHLDRPDALHLLTRLAAATRRLLLVTDLRRSRLGLAVASAACRLLTRSPIVRFDGPASVRAAFTPAELRALARAAGLPAARVRTLWPWRMQLLWQREAAA